MIFFAYDKRWQFNIAQLQFTSCRLSSVRVSNVQVQQKETYVSQSNISQTILMQLLGGSTMFGPRQLSKALEDLISRFRQFSECSERFICLFFWSCPKTPVLKNTKTLQR